MNESLPTYGDVDEAAHSEQTFRKFCAEQRARSEEDRLALLERIPNTDWLLKVRFAVRCLRKPEQLEPVFRDALMRADASGIQFVVGHMSNRLGFGKMLGAVEELLWTDRRAFEKAIYWIWVDPDGPQRKYWPLYIKMLRAAKQMGFRLPVDRSGLAHD